MMQTKTIKISFKNNPEERFNSAISLLQQNGFEVDSEHAEEDVVDDTDDIEDVGDRYQCPHCAKEILVTLKTVTVAG